MKEKIIYFNGGYAVKFPEYMENFVEDCQDRSTKQYFEQYLPKCDKHKIIPMDLDKFIARALKFSGLQGVRVGRVAM